MPISEDEQYDNITREAEETLRPRLTDEFLATLAAAAETVGWGVDFTEIESFVDEVYHIAGKEKPSLKPVGFDD